MCKVREPAVAGMFYPGDPAELRIQVDSFLQAPSSAATDAPKALIVPHAGYPYSGPVAGTAYARLHAAAAAIQRVVLLGPAHRTPVAGLALPGVDAFESPLGRVKLDQKACTALRALPQVTVDERAHAMEHSLEVQLPFLQQVLNHDFLLIPLVVGEATPDQVAQVLDQVWGGPETLVVVSSDLSHYKDYETARRLDLRTSQAIEGLDVNALRPEDACGCTPIRGLLAAARQRGLHVENVDLRSSGDTAGGRDQVVGYGAYVLY